ncbi:tyrosine-protein kinase receptor torso [Hermetia illucens]|uniref:tyrosine-protein kinase receptor torso n=1 Tax=Hermetia illucens TaxID=343691 RepID=UPI0018CC4D27|nr:tyrosine-protein kinase receptor torso [Hermetia illucens]
MQMVIIKYISVFCFTLFFGYNHCDQLLVEVSSDSRIRQESACVARCLGEKKISSLKRCYKTCSEETNFPPLIRESNYIWTMELLCRNNTNLVFRISNQTNYNITSDYYGSDYDNDVDDSDMDPSGPTNNEEASHDNIFILWIYKATEGLSKQLIFLANSAIVNVGDLNQNSSYVVSLTMVTSNNRVTRIVENAEFTTLPDVYKPADVKNITLIKFEAEKDKKGMLQAQIGWLPADDMTCFYDVVLFYAGVPAVKEIRQPEELYTLTHHNISVGSSFQVGVRGVHKYNNKLFEGDLQSQEFQAPACLDWYRNNLTVCAPEKPKGLQVNHTHLSSNKYSISISWETPKQMPNYYGIKILDLDRKTPNETKINVTGDQTSQYIPSITINGFEYEVHLIAVSEGGKSSTMLGKTIDVLHIAGKSYALKLVSSIMIPILFIIFAALVMILVCNRRAKLKRYQERCKYFEELEKKAPVDPNSNFEFPVKTMPSNERLNLLQQQLENKLYINDVMEIDRDNVVLLDEVLGEGAFGLVRKGIAKLNTGKECDVAVKMLKDNPSIEDIKEFRREIDVMKFVGDHPNIVGIIGHCTKNIKEMLLLTEYCSRGNLLDYLRSEWHYHQSKQLVQNDIEDCCIAKLMDDKQPESIFNFDTSFIDKISISYKNISNQNTNESSPHILASPSGISEKEHHDDSAYPTNIVVNNAYELTTKCTSSCKCQVDIIPKNECLKTNEFETKYNNKIEIKGCKCRIRMLAVNESGSPIAIENHGYYKLITPKILDNIHTGEEGKPIVDGGGGGKNDRLTSGDLLQMAKQIALGMEFLSKNKVVHRDLAARNVLVSEDKSVKIADFGLSRDIYQENIYKKTGNGKLPIKWLALESMTHQVYTSQSDVWSYGVLLYEIVTLGGTPYPLIPTNRLLKLLKAGYRMEKPKNCSEALYDLMRSCWRTKPTERPTFTEVCRSLDELLMHSPEDETINLSLTEHVAKRSKSSSEESYLKPI